MTNYEKRLVELAKLMDETMKESNIEISIDLREVVSQWNRLFGYIQALEEISDREV